MLTEELRISVLSAPLAAIDRRALSQAWYSALHYARDIASTGGGREPAPRKEWPARSAETLSAQRRVPASDGTRVASRSSGLKALKNGRSCGAAVERRAPRSPLARDIERALFNPHVQRRRATLNAGPKRVVVTVAADARGVRFVALCAPSMKSAVAVALAQARFALAGRRIPCF